MLKSKLELFVKVLCCAALLLETREWSGKELRSLQIGLGNRADYKQQFRKSNNSPEKKRDYF